MSRAKLFLYGLILSILSLTACSKDEADNPLSHPSYRDRIYSGDKLSVYLNGKKMVSVISADVKSEQNMSKSNEGSTTAINPVYDTTVRLSGFPAQGNESTLQTTSTLEGFSGKITVKNVDYSYEAQFTGGPLDAPEKQGLIIYFTAK